MTREMYVLDCKEAPNSPDGPPYNPDSPSDYLNDLLGVGKSPTPLTWNTGSFTISTVHH